VDNKTCSKCNCFKPASSFSKKKANKDGLQRSCKDCTKSYLKSYYQKNKESMDARSKEYVAKHREKVAKYKKDYDQENKESLNKQKRKWASKNRGYYNYKSNERRCNKLSATPPWSDLNRIKTIYTTCQNITKVTGKEHHVDHIIPLKGKDICGLHVWWNLRIVPAKINLSKGNKVETF